MQKIFIKGESKLKNKGLIHIYYGDGKGKTTAALGLAIRALGAGLSVGIVQFMKGYPYSEVSILENLDKIKLIQTGRPDYIYKGKETKKDVEEANRGIKEAKKMIYEEMRDLVILDEISVAIEYNLIKEIELLNIIDKKPENTELIITGRNPSKNILKKGDYLSEIKSIKHPYEKGILSRKGIDH